MPNSPPACFTLFPGCEFVRQKKKQIESNTDWIQAFTLYTVALTSKFPSATCELLAYQLTIIKASEQYDGLYWRAYDTHYRINTAATGNKQWLQLDTDLYTRFTSRAKAVTACSMCDGTHHSTADCLRRQRKRELGKTSTQSPPMKKKMALQHMRSVQRKASLQLCDPLQVQARLQRLWRSSSQPKLSHQDEAQRGIAPLPPPPLLTPQTRENS